MRRRALDVLVSTGGLILAAVLSVAGALLLWGQQVVNGQQAEVFADHYPVTACGGH